MAQHLTAALSFGSPPPSFPHTNGDQLSVDSIIRLLDQRESVHLSSLDKAKDVLRAAGLTDAEIAKRMHVADGSPA